MERRAAPKAKAPTTTEARSASPGPQLPRAAPVVPPRLPTPGFRPASATPTPTWGRPLIEMQQGELEHRIFPRAKVALRFELWRERDGERQFSASLTSANVSVSGAFVESTFFLPVGTELRVRFVLEEGTAPVEARAVIVREERGERGGRSGFGMRFEEFYNQSDVALAKLFLGVRLRAFAEEYLQSRRAKSLSGELERVVDALTAWELLKATQAGNDPWQNG